MAIQPQNQESQLQPHRRVGGPNHRVTTAAPDNLRPLLHSQTMNRPKLDLKLNLSSPNRITPRVEPPSRSMTTSPASSCVSSELSQADDYDDGSALLQYSSSPEATSMMLVGCPRCLMYVMLAEKDPRCPKCKSTVLLDVIHDNNCTTAIKTTNAKP